MLLRVLWRVGLELAFEAIRLGNSIPPGVSIVGNVGGNADMWLSRLGRQSSSERFVISFLVTVHRAW